MSDGEDLPRWKNEKGGFSLARPVRSQCRLFSLLTNDADDQFRTSTKEEVLFIYFSMSAHEGVSCDACGKSNFRCKRYKCLICYDYDLCATCYEHGETSSHHTIEHPMQCKARCFSSIRRRFFSSLVRSAGILTRQDFDFYYHGERCTSDQPQSLTCPFCGEMGLALPFSFDSSSMTNPLQSFDLFNHLQLKHADDQQSTEVICPICAAMANGEPNLMTGDLLAHIANDHQHTAVQTPSSAGTATNPYSRQTSSNRDIDFTGGSSNGRGNFRRGPLRAPGRRGGGLGRGGGTVSQHFVVDPSAVSGATDPIADLLTQLSTVRRLAAANNNASSSSSSASNTINLQALTRQQYERERLRAAGRSVQQTSSSSTTTTATGNTSSASNPILSNENDFFDSLFSSALFIDPSANSPNVSQTWAQIVAQHQPNATEQPPQQQPQPASSSTSKPASVEADQSLLKKFCDESSTSSSNTSVSRRRHDFVHSLLLSSFICPLNDNDK